VPFTLATDPLTVVEPPSYSSVKLTGLESECYARAQVDGPW
jgi:hypothetical protein